MMQDLYGFTNNDYFKDIIIDEGAYYVSYKTYFSIVIYIITILMLSGMEYWTIEKLFNFKNLTLTIILLFFNFYTFLKYIKPLYFQSKSKHWLKYEADIKSLYISKRHIPVAYVNTTSYIPVITYKYTVNNQNYEGNQLSFNISIDDDHTLSNDISSNDDDMNMDFSRWLDTKKVSIYYNPERPSQSVIYRELKGFYYFYFFMGIVPFILGGALFSSSLYFTFKSLF